MYPTLTDWIYDWFGVNIPLPIQSYGFMMALAFIAGATILILEFKRKEKEGKLQAIPKEVTIGLPPQPKDIAISAITGFIVGFKTIEGFLFYNDLVRNPQEFILSARGSMWGGILFAAIFGIWTYYDQKRQQLPKPKKETKLIHPHELTGTIIVLAAIWGIIGSKIFDTLDHVEDLFTHPIETIFSFSGLSFFGGLIVAGAAIIIYAQKNNIKVLHLGDVVAPGLALSYAIGRIGCQISGDGCWGIQNPNPKPEWLSWLPDWAWAYNFPHNVINEGVKIAGDTSLHNHILPVPVFPTSFYETTMMLIVFVILWSLRKKIKTPGILFGVYLFFAGLERFIIETIRVNIPYHFLGIEATQAQIISVFLMLGAIIFIYILNKNKQKLATY